MTPTDHDKHGRRPLIAVFGVYKSGTTALHHRILGALEPGTRELFEPAVYQRRPEDRETGVLAKVIVRPHGRYQPRVDYRAFAGFDKRLVIVRDPRDWLVSAMLFTPQQWHEALPAERLDRIIETLREKESDPRSLPMAELWDVIGLGGGAEVGRHLGALSDVRALLGEHLEVRYEDMVAGHLSPAEEYLGRSLSEPPKLPEHQAHVPRTLSSGGWRDWFCPEDIGPMQALLGPFVEQFGYDADDWELNDDPRIPHEHCSGYVERTIASRRAAEPQVGWPAQRGPHMARSGPMRFEESQLFPVEASELAGRALVLAPHPDDESLGCGGTLTLHRERGDQVRVVFVTSGERGLTAASAPAEGLVQQREAEAGAALAWLGVDDWAFWRQPDREVFAAPTAALLETELASGAYDLVYAPAPTDPHPDHRAVAHAVRDAVLRSEGKPRVCFYEVGAPTQINTLVAVDEVLEKKRGAIAAYAGQVEGEYDYAAASEGISRYRAMPLTDGRVAAEGFRVVEAADLDADPIWAWAALQERGVQGKPQASSISVVLRTRDRPHRLAEALASLESQTISDFEVVLVDDDGGASRPVSERFKALDITHVEREGVGPAAALNAGLEAATGDLVAYLDDDDVFFPDHLAELRDFLDANPAYIGAYSDAYAAHHAPSADGREQVAAPRAVELSQDFDPDLLLHRSYIPLICVMHRREAAVAAGGFDAEMPRLEDWEFLIRLSQLGPLRHLRFATAEYRIHAEALSQTSDPGASELIDRAHEMIFERYRSQRLAGAEARTFDRVYSELSTLRRQVAALSGVRQRQAEAVESPATAGARQQKQRHRQQDDSAELRKRLRDTRAVVAKQRAALEAVQGSRWWRLRAGLARLRPGR